jgi:hypothetical protein
VAVIVGDNTMAVSNKTRECWWQHGVWQKVTVVRWESGSTLGIRQPKVQDQRGVWLSVIVDCDKKREGVLASERCIDASYRGVE